MKEKKKQTNRQTNVLHISHSRFTFIYLYKKQMQIFRETINAQ